MKISTRVLVLTGLAFTGAAGAATGQTEEERRRLEARLEELRSELRQVEQELGRLRGRAWTRTRALDYFTPRVLTLTSNHGRMGVTVQSRADETTDTMGAQLTSVVEDGPAAEAGLEAGDIITRFNGEPLTGRYPPAGPDESEPARKLVDLVREMEEGDEVTVEYVRDGQQRTATMTLRRIEPEADWLPDVSFGGNRVRYVTPRSDFNWTPLPDAAGVITLMAGPWADMELVTVNEGLGRYFGTSEGLLVVKAPEHTDGLQVGDVILNINGREVPSPSRAMRILRTYEPSEEITLEIMRDQRRQTVTITAPDLGLRHQRQRYEYHWPDVSHQPHRYEFNF